jgi:ribose transport system permease protein
MSIAASEAKGVRGMRARGFRVTPRWVILLAVAVLLVLSEITHGGSFFSQATLSTLTPFVGVMLIASLGQAVVIGTGGIDLSIPSPASRTIAWSLRSSWCSARAP